MKITNRKRTITLVDKNGSNLTEEFGKKWIVEVMITSTIAKIRSVDKSNKYLIVDIYNDPNFALKKNPKLPKVQFYKHDNLKTPIVLCFGSKSRKGSSILENHGRRWIVKSEEDSYYCCHSLKTNEEYLLNKYGDVNFEVDVIVDPIENHTNLLRREEGPDPNKYIVKFSAQSAIDMNQFEEKPFPMRV